MSAKPASAGSFLAAYPVSVLVTVADAQGSAPREAGAFMLVSASASHGTVGGGQLEYAAIDRARIMIRNNQLNCSIDIALGPEIGQCCGGRVTLQLNLVIADLAEQLAKREAAELAGRPHVYIFGAGHVGSALSSALSLLPLRTVLVDGRRSELDAAPDGVEKRLSALPEDFIRRAPSSSGFLILTHDHALDFLLAREALGRADAAYVGMIGSKSKRAAFSSWYLREGGEEAQLSKLICPIGTSGLKDKRPDVIAALTAAEVVSALFGRKSELAAAKPSIPVSSAGSAPR